MIKPQDTRPQANSHRVIHMSGINSDIPLYGIYKYVIRELTQYHKYKDMDTNSGTSRFEEYNYIEEMLIFS